MLDAAISGFSSASGVTSAHLNLLVRSVLCGIFLLWAAWNTYGHMRLVQDQHYDLHDLAMGLLRILLLCTWIILLIFVN